MNARARLHLGLGNYFVCDGGVVASTVQAGLMEPSRGNLCQPGFWVIMCQYRLGCGTKHASPVGVFPVGEAGEDM